ncbi:hypothetical protein IAT40_000151 [Kwoniella sp. CBS 6097]
MILPADPDPTSKLNSNLITTEDQEEAEMCSPPLPSVATSGSGSGSGSETSSSASTGSHRRSLVHSSEDDSGLSTVSSSSLASPLLAMHIDTPTAEIDPSTIPTIPVGATQPVKLRIPSPPSASTYDSSSTASASASASANQEKPKRQSQPQPQPQSHPRWRLSPETIRLEQCSCTRPKRKYIASLITSNDYLKFNLDRLDKVWLRIAHLQLFPEVKEAAERVIRCLREDRGLELFHLAATDQIQSALRGGAAGGENNKRREISILFLIPHSDDEVVGHRLVAELLVHLRLPRQPQPKPQPEPRRIGIPDEDSARNGSGSGSGRGRVDRLSVENIATRFAEDWEDWTLSHPHTYLKPDPDPDSDPDHASNLTEDSATTAASGLELEPGVLEMGIPDKKEGVSWSMIVDSLLIETQKLLNGYWVDRKEFKRFFTRVSTELRAEGRRVYAFQLEKVYRSIAKHSHGTNARSKSKSKNDNVDTPIDTKSTVPCVRIALKILESTMSSDSKKKKEMIGNDIGAVVLLDLNDVDKRGRIKNLCVIYDGEWPIAHQYRSVIPPPNLEGIQHLIKE